MPRFPPALDRRSPRHLAGAAILLAAAFTAGNAGAEDIPEPVVQLILGGGIGAEGSYWAAIEAVLGPGWHTYWRYPGDAGVAPVFDSSGSVNLAALSVLYPAPQRFAEGPLATIGYADSVAFPLVVTPADPALPVELSLTLSYAYCREVCVPGEAASRVTLHPDAPRDSGDAARVAAAFAAVPRPEGVAGLRLTPLEVAGQDLLTIGVILDGAATADLFAEGPPGWYPPLPAPVGARDGVAWFTLPAPPGPAELRFTAVTATGVAVEAVRRTPEESR